MKSNCTGESCDSEFEGLLRMGMISSDAALILCVASLYLWAVSAIEAPYPREAESFDPPSIIERPRRLRDRGDPPCPLTTAYGSSHRLFTSTLYALRSGHSATLGGPLGPSRALSGWSESGRSSRPFLSPRFRLPPRRGRPRERLAYPSLTTTTAPLTVGQDAPC